MQALDIAFLQQYIQLDALLGDLFDSERGVNDYLEAMEDEDNTAHRLQVAAWTEDYQNLRHLRHLRNKITHEPSEDGFCSQADLELLQSFHQRVVERDGPMARLQRAMEEAEDQRTPPPSESRVWPIVFLVLFVASILATVYFNLIK